jgi:hypothetical protein
MQRPKMPRKYAITYLLINPKQKVRNDTMNLEAFKRLRAHMAMQPEEAIDMATFAESVKHPCGTSHCFAGHAVLAEGGRYELGRFSSNGRTVDPEFSAARLLGISSADADLFFFARLNIGGYHATKAQLLETLDIIIENNNIYAAANRTDEHDHVDDEQPES